MWVEGGDIHDELLDQLGAVLTAPQDLALTPSAAEVEALAAAVAARWPTGTTAPAAPAPVRHPSSAGRRPLRRLGSSAWRAGSVAAGIVVFSASAAAAANGGVPLPRPVRVVAYTVGLPVDSPALDDTNQHIEDLKEAVKANDKPKAEATARRLRTDLKKVPSHEKEEAEQKVEAAMAIATPLIVAPTPTTTTTAPTPPSTAAPAPAPSTTATTAAVEDSDKEKDTDRATVTTTTVPPTTTTTAPEPTTTTTAPETDEIPSEGTPPGDPGTDTGDPNAGGAGTGGGDQGSTTPTTTPDDGTTTTTIPDGGGTSGGGDPGSTTTTTSSTTTTTMPPADPGDNAQPQP